MARAEEPNDSGMLLKILFICLLVVSTVTIHAVGFATLLRVMIRSHALEKEGFRPVTLLVIALTAWLIVVHLVEISVWGLFYFWQGCLPNVESSLYFSAVTYTTLGDGALALPGAWRMFAPPETLTALLMCGLSTALFFALVSRWHGNWMKWKAARELTNG